MRFPPDNASFLASAGDVGGRVAALRQVCDIIDGRAAKAFKEHNDNVAHELRNIAHDLRYLLKANEQELQMYVDEAVRRKNVVAHLPKSKRRK